MRKCSWGTWCAHAPPADMPVFFSLFFSVEEKENSVR